MTELVRWRFRVWYLQKSISNRLQHFLNIANFAIVFARIVMSESRKCCGAMSLKILKGQGGQESAMLYQSFPLVLRKSGHLWQDPDLPRPTHCLFHPETEARVPTQQIGGSAWIPRWICEKIHWNIALVVSKIYWMCLFSWKWVLILDLHILDGSSSNLTMVFWLKKRGILRNFNAEGGKWFSVLPYPWIGGSSDNPIYRCFPDTFHFII